MRNLSLVLFSCYFSPFLLLFFFLLFDSRSCIFLFIFIYLFFFFAFCLRRDIYTFTQDRCMGCMGAQIFTLHSFLFPTLAPLLFLLRSSTSQNRFLRSMISSSFLSLPSRFSLVAFIYPCCNIINTSLPKTKKKKRAQLE